MKIAAVKEAIAEAERFLRAAKNVNTDSYTDGNGKVHTLDPWGKDSAACKRASMDLSRALSKMRQS